MDRLLVAFGFHRECAIVIGSPGHSDHIKHRQIGQAGGSGTDGLGAGNE
jgi:hypothetical protein